MVVCDQVLREISNYVNNDVDPQLRAEMDKHFLGCQRCTSVLVGMRNVIHLYTDERMLEIPLGFSQRMHRGLKHGVGENRRGFLGWMVAAAAAVLVVGGFEVARSQSSVRSNLRSEHARSAGVIPPQMMVVVAADGRLFHLAECAFIHATAKKRTISVLDAILAGYTPCGRCLGQYLS
jgi:hypothetical protein